MSLTSLRVREDVFYDGDNFLPPVQALHDGLSPLVLDELYLDTSYCSPQYQTFPSRPQSEEKIWELCQKWIRKNGMFKDTRARHVILFHLPPRYGYESILRHVFMKSLRSWQVHVSPTSLNEQLCQSEVSGCVNTDPGVAQWIHACHKADKRSANQPLLKQLPCQLGEFEVCQIKPSTMYFTQSKMKGLEAAGHDRLVSVSQGGSNYRYWEQHIWLSIHLTAECATQTTPVSQSWRRSSDISLPFKSLPAPFLPTPARRRSETFSVPSWTETQTTAPHTTAPLPPRRNLLVTR